MSFRAASVRFGFALAVLAMGGLMVCSAQTQPRKHGRKLEESTTSPPALTNQLGSQSDGLRRLEEELGSPLRSFSPDNEQEAIMPPNYFPRTSPAVQRPRERDRRRDLLSLTAVELLMPGASGDDLFGTPGEKNDELTRKMSIEQLYGELNGRPPGEKKSGAARVQERDMLGTRKTADTSKGQDEEDANLPQGIRDSEKNLREMLNAGSGASALNQPTVGRSSFAELFGSVNTRLTPEQEAAHKEYMDKYKQILGISPTPAFGANPLAAFDSSVRAPTPSGPAGLPGLPGHFGFDANPSAANGLINPVSIPDLSAKLLNQWNPLYTPPKPEPNRPVPISVPMSQVPRRVF